MLKINPNPQFSVDVKLTEPGTENPAIVKIIFRYKNRDEMIDFSERTKGKPIEDVLCEIIHGWEGIDADCNAENIAMLAKNYIPAGLEILNAYYKELSASRVKN